MCCSIQEENISVKCWAAAERECFFCQMTAPVVVKAGVSMARINSGAPCNRLTDDSGTMATPRPSLTQSSNGVTSSLTQRILRQYSAMVGA